MLQRKDYQNLSNDQGPQIQIYAFIDPCQSFECYVMCTTLQNFQYHRKCVQKRKCTFNPNVVFYGTYNSMITDGSLMNIYYIYKYRIKVSQIGDVNQKCR